MNRKRGYGIKIQITALEYPYNVDQRSNKSGTHLVHFIGHSRILLVITSHVVPSEVKSLIPYTVRL